MDGWMDGWMDGVALELIDGLDGWMEGRLDRWMDGCINIFLIQPRLFLVMSLL